MTGRGPGVAGWPAADSGRGEPRRQWRDRQSNECRLCGSAPAVPVDLRPQSSGLLRTLYTGGGPVERGPLCRSCGLAVLRDLTDVALCGGRPTGRFGDRPNHRTLVADVLVLGWLRNLLTVIGNLSFWVTLRRLGPPVRDPRVRSPLIAPLEPGPSLWARRGGAVVLVVLGLALMVGLVLVAVRLGLGGGGHPLVVLVQHNGWSYFSRTARLPG